MADQTLERLLHVALLADGLIPLGFGQTDARGHLLSPQKERLLRDNDTYITLNLDTKEDSMLLLGWTENGQLGVVGKTDLN